MPEIERLGEGWFQQDGGDPAHIATALKVLMNITFPHWIGNKGCLVAPSFTRSFAPRFLILVPAERESVLDDDY